MAPGARLSMTSCVSYASSNCGSVPENFVQSGNDLRGAAQRIAAVRHKLEVCYFPIRSRTPPWMNRGWPIVSTPERPTRYTVSKRFSTAR